MNRHHRQEFNRIKKNLFFEFLFYLIFFFTTIIGLEFWDGLIKNKEIEKDFFGVFEKTYNFLQFFL
jgi:hypothetical protein